MKDNYLVKEDIKLAKEIRNYSDKELAEIFNVRPMTIYRWLHNDSNINDNHLEDIYNGLFSKGLRLNKIKEQFYREEYENKSNIILFHGSKTGIDGKISINKSSDNNDFGKGFYCGENFEQSAMFVSGKEKSSVYILRFNKSNSKGYELKVDREWLLAITCFRDKAGIYKDHPVIKKIRNKISKYDYVVAPIADNKMFDLIDEFINGEITDIQAEHSLSATNLGKQYVFLNDNVLNSIDILQRCYLCNREKEDYLSIRRNSQEINNDKVKSAKRNYRGQGQYIDEILK